MGKKRVRSDHAPWSRPYCKRAWSVAERIAYYSTPDPLSGCHIWHGFLKGGYGYLRYRNRPWFAHRLAWEVKHGPIPAGMVLRHRCNVRCCVNPDHLVPGTNAENSADLKAARLRLTDARLATAKGRRGPGPRPIRIFYDGVELTGDVVLKVVRPA
jgi:HNH endonuclease